MTPVDAGKHDMTHVLQEHYFYEARIFSQERPVGLSFGVARTIPRKLPSPAYSGCL